MNEPCRQLAQQPLLGKRHHEGLPDAGAEPVPARLRTRHAEEADELGGVVGEDAHRAQEHRDEDQCAHWLVAL
jgi:hypothetical protein